MDRQDITAEDANDNTPPLLTIDDDNQSPSQPASVLIAGIPIATSNYEETTVEDVGTESQGNTAIINQSDLLQKPEDNGPFQVWIDRAIITLWMTAIVILIQMVLLMAGAMNWDPRTFITPIPIPFPFNLSYIRSKLEWFPLEIPEHLTLTQAKSVDFTAGGVIAPLIIATANSLWFTIGRQLSSSPRPVHERPDLEFSDVQGSFSMPRILGLLRTTKPRLILFVLLLVTSAVASTCLSNVLGYKAVESVVSRSAVASSDEVYYQLAYVPALLFFALCSITIASIVALILVLDARRSLPEKVDEQGADTMEDGARPARDTNSRIAWVLPSGGWKLPTFPKLPFSALRGPVTSNFQATDAILDPPSASRSKWSLPATFWKLPSLPQVRRQNTQSSSSESASRHSDPQETQPLLSGNDGEENANIAASHIQRKWKNSFTAWMPIIWYSRFKRIAEIGPVVHRDVEALVDVSTPEENENHEVIPQFLDSIPTLTSANTIAGSAVWKFPRIRLPKFTAVFKPVVLPTVEALAQEVILCGTDQLSRQNESLIDLSDAAENERSSHTQHIKDTQKQRLIEVGDILDETVGESSTAPLYEAAIAIAHGALDAQIISDVVTKSALGHVDKPAGESLRTPIYRAATELPKHEFASYTRSSTVWKYPSINLPYFSLRQKQKPQSKGKQRAVDDDTGLSEEISKIQHTTPRLPAGVAHSNSTSNLLQMPHIDVEAAVAKLTFEENPWQLTKDKTQWSWPKLGWPRLVDLPKSRTYTYPDRTDELPRLPTLTTIRNDPDLESQDLHVGTTAAEWASLSDPVAKTHRGGLWTWRWPTVSSSAPNIASDVEGTIESPAERKEAAAEVALIAATTEGEVGGASSVRGPPSETRHHDHSAWWRGNSNTQVRIKTIGKPQAKNIDGEEGITDRNYADDDDVDDNIPKIGKQQKPADSSSEQNIGREAEFESMVAIQQYLGF